MKWKKGNLRSPKKLIYEKRNKIKKYMRLYNGKNSVIDVPLVSQRIVVKAHSVSRDFMPSTEFLKMMSVSFDEKEVALIVTGAFEGNMCANVPAVQPLCVSSLDEALVRFVKKEPEKKEEPAPEPKVEPKEEKVEEKPVEEPVEEPAPEPEPIKEEVKVEEPVEEPVPAKEDTPVVEEEPKKTTKKSSRKKK